MKSGEQLKRLHPMQAFGVVSGLMKRVRVTRLEQRVVPLVPFPHKHDFFHIVIPTRGSGWHEIDFQRYALGEGRIFVMKPAQVHAWTLDAGVAGYIVEFESSSLPLRSTAHSSIRALLQSTTDCLDLSADAARALFALVEIMAQEYERRATNFELALQSCLTAMLLMLARADPSLARDGTREQDVLAAFVSLLDEHYRRHHDVEFYARELGMSAKALTMRTSRAKGQSARGLIQDRLLLESKRLLAYSDLTIGEVAEELGFEDPNYFSRFFRKKAKLSPGRFRKGARSLC